MRRKRSSSCYLWKLTLIHEPPLPASDAGGLGVAGGLGRWLGASAGGLPSLRGLGLSSLRGLGLGLGLRGLGRGLRGLRNSRPSSSPAAARAGSVSSARNTFFRVESGLRSLERRVHVSWHRG
jgi:hypothetical protein